MSLTVISEAGDLIIEVVQYDAVMYGANGNRASQLVGQFIVDRNVLIEASQPLLKLLLDPRWKEETRSAVCIGEGRIASTTVWLQVIHKAALDLTLPFKEVWHLVAAIDYYDLDLTIFKPWFAAWYDAHKPELLEARALIFPTWRFDHAKGFARWTRNLAYDMSGHITEANPAKLYKHHLPSRIVQQLNAAKGRLRTVLHRKLFGLCADLFNADCACKKETLFDYQKHLVDIKVWPLETVFQKTPMSDILERLEKFKFEAKPGACGTCRKDYNGKVASAQEYVEDYFDGLCLDCLDRSKPKLRDTDLDYWRHHKLKENEWIKGCRFPHKQPTWYFSFNGRKEERDRMIEKFNGEPGRRGSDFNSDSDQDDNDG